MTPVRYHQAAEDELLDEIGYLKLRVPGLGRRFYAEVRRAENLIAQLHESAQEVLPGIRKHTVPFVASRSAPCYALDMNNSKGTVYECTAFFDANEHGGYTVVVPALPGLVTEGKTLGQARRMVKDAVRCYIEGMNKANEPIPFEGETAQFRLAVRA